CLFDLLGHLGGSIVKQAPFDVQCIGLIGLTLGRVVVSEMKLLARLMKQPAALLLEVGAARSGRSGGRGTRISQRRCHGRGARGLRLTRWRRGAAASRRRSRSKRSLGISQLG